MDDLKIAHLQAQSEVKRFDEFKNTCDILNQARDMVRQYELKRADMMIDLRDRYGATYRELSRIAGIKPERCSEIVSNRRFELDSQTD